MKELNREDDMATDVLPDLIAMALFKVASVTGIVEIGIDEIEMTSLASGYRLEVVEEGGIWIFKISPKVRGSQELQPPYLIQ